MKLKLKSGLVTNFLLLCQAGAPAALQDQFFETPEILRVDIVVASDQMDSLHGSPKVGAVATVTEK